MSDTLWFLVVVALAWFGIGVVLSVVMGRKGHNSFGWFVLGAVLGPLGILLAVDAGRHGEEFATGPQPVGAPGTVGTGPVDVLVGFDRSSESVAALDAAVELFGERLGRLTAATVVPYGDIREEERRAVEGLEGLAQRSRHPAPQLEILHGHPSTALGQYAAEGGYEVIAVGTRGAGISRAILGSAASELARDSKVPVLLVGGRGAAPTAGPAGYQ